MTEAQLLADRLRYLSQNHVGLKESQEIVDSLPRIVAMLDLVACPNPADIGNAIIAGIADGDTVLEKMAAVVDHLRLAGFVIVPIRWGVQGMTDAVKLAERLWRHEGSGVEALRNLRSQNSLLDQSETTQAKWLGYARVALDFCAVQPRYFSGCLRDGVCRGVCRNTDCPNYDLVVAARLVVENRVEGIVYPAKEE